MTHKRPRGRPRKNPYPCCIDPGVLLAVALMALCMLGVILRLPGLPS
jgi:hypothetical protein